MNNLSVEELDNILSYLSPKTYKCVSKYYNNHANERLNKYASIISKNIKCFFIQKKIITSMNSSIELNRSRGLYGAFRQINMMTYNPVYCKIYLIKFYPRSLLKRSLIFYASNINRYEMQYEEDILKMIIFIVFYMQSEEIIKLKELLRILPKKNYINMYESFIKFSVLTRYHKSNN